MMGDSQAVKNTCNASVETKGFCFYKATNGIKRYLIVHTLGFPFFTGCTPANVSDDLGLLYVLLQNLDYFKAKPLNIAKITILLDHGYHPEKLQLVLEAVYPQIMQKIRFELSSKPSRAEKAVQGKTGFVPVAKRWVVERSDAWIERCKSLMKNCERTLAHAKAKLARPMFCTADAQAPNCAYLKISNRLYRRILGIIEAVGEALNQILKVNSVSKLVPLSLALQIIGLNPQSHGLIQVWLGQLPDNLIVEIPVLDREEVVASVQQGKSYRVLIYSSQPPLQLQTWYSNKLRSLGWLQWESESNPISNNLFIKASNRNLTSTIPSAFYYAPCSITLTLHLHAASENTTHVKISLSNDALKYSPCQAEWERHPLNLIPVPKLISPAIDDALASRLENYCLMERGGGSEHDWDSQSLLKTSLDTYELLSYYDLQLAQSGWTRQAGNVQGRLSWSVWTLHDIHKSVYQLWLSFIADNNESNAHAAFLRVLRLQDSDQNVSYSSANTLKQHDVIPEEILWNLLSDEFLTDVENKQLWIGELPSALSEQLVFPSRSRILGSISDGANCYSDNYYISSFISVSILPIQIYENLSAQLLTSGWLEASNSNKNHSVFITSTQPHEVYATFIHPSRQEQCLIILKSLTHKSTDVTLRWANVDEETIDGLMSTSQVTDDDEIEKKKLPILSQAAGTEVFPETSLIVEGRSEFIVDLFTSLSEETLVEHYQSEMQKSGWQLQVISEHENCHFSLWSLVEEKREGILGFVRSPEDHKQYLGYFRVIA